MLNIKNDSKPMNVRHRGNVPIQYTFKTRNQPMQHYPEPDEVSDSSDEEIPQNSFPSFGEVQQVTPPTVGVPMVTPPTVGVQMVTPPMEQSLNNDTLQTIEHLEELCSQLLERIQKLENQEDSPTLDSYKKIENRMIEYKATTTGVTETMNQLTQAFTQLANNRIADMEKRLTTVEQKKSKYYSCWSTLLVVLLTVVMGFGTLNLLMVQEPSFVPYT